MCPYKYKHDDKLQDETAREHLERMRKLQKEFKVPEATAVLATPSGEKCLKSPTGYHAVDITKEQPRNCIFCGEPINEQ